MRVRPRVRELETLGTRKSTSYSYQVDISFTFDHRTLRTRLPVRSALFKQRTGGLVVRWVTTGESPLLNVFDYAIFFPRYCNAADHVDVCKTKKAIQPDFMLSNPRCPRSSSCLHAASALFYCCRTLCHSSAVTSATVWPRCIVLNRRDAFLSM
jgi:hypothetical protein